MDFKIETFDKVTELHNCKRFSTLCTDLGFIILLEPSSIVIWEGSKQLFHLAEHRRSVLAICISCAPQPYLCSCSTDKVILWSMYQIREGGNATRGSLVGSDLGVVNACALSCDNSWLVLCREYDIWHTGGVLSAVSHHATLDTCGPPGLSCQFSPINPDLFITSDDSNTMKVWSADAGRVVQRSAVEGWQRISTCEFVTRGRYRGHLLVSTNRGSLHLFAVNSSRPPRDLGRVLVAPPLAPTTATSSAGDGCEAGCVVLSALLLDRGREGPAGTDEPSSTCSSGLQEPLPEALEQEDSTVRTILAPGSLLIACSNLGVGVYDCNSWDCYSFLPYSELVGEGRGRDPEEDPDTNPDPSGQAPLLLSAASLTGRSPDRILCLLSGWADRATAYLLTLSCTSCPRSGDNGAPNGVSFLSACPPSLRSPLRAQLRPATDRTSTAALYGSGPQRKAPGHRTVKSSGYGATPPRTQMFIPVLNSRPHTSKVDLPSHGKDSDPAAAGRGLLGRLDDTSLPLLNWTPPLRQKTKLSIWNDFGTEIRLASSGDGVSLACSSGPGVLSVLRWGRPSVDDCVRIQGHDGRINWLDFSLNSVWLVSAGSDGRTKVWDWRNRRCVLDIDASPSGPGGARGGSGQRVGPVGADSGTAGRTRVTRVTRDRVVSVTQAAFYYMDRFILHAVDGALDLYSHRLHEDQRDNKYRFGLRDWKRVRRIKFPTQQVTCFIAPNTFHSNLVVAGCASRSLHVYDVDSERFLLELPDAHRRAPHAMAQVTPSSATSRDPAAADLFLSTSVCDGAKLWDLRQARCVQKYTRHLNRAHSCGVALSPCCRYLAAGSEDKCVYLYDTRQCHDYVDKLFGLNEVVLDVEWNSSRPQLAASALNSCVALYAT